MKNWISLLNLLFIASIYNLQAQSLKKITPVVNQKVKVITKVNPVDVSDISLYAPKPYRELDAGYNFKDFKKLSEKNKIDFTHVKGKSDTEALNAVIAKLSRKGGGEITIKKGTYNIKGVNLKSNIHLYIENNTLFRMQNTKQGKRFLFNIGMLENKRAIENVRIVGLGTIKTRPKLILTKYVNTFYRAIAIGYSKNVLIENLTIEDNFTKGAAIAFNPVKINENSADIAENVTIANVSLTGASIGYGLVQTNVGKNILLKNLSCEGGMTCRIEAHTGRRYDLGVDNIVIKNVSSINGKAAVLLQPHSVVNGRILVDGAKSSGSTWTLFLKKGFVNKESKRKKEGSFAASSYFRNISMESTNSTATLSYKNFKFVPAELKKYYKDPYFKPVFQDANYKVKDGKLNKESAVIGASISPIYIDAPYTMELPKETAIILTGETSGRPKILNNIKP